MWELSGYAGLFLAALGAATLLPIAAPTAWSAGGTAEVAWQVTANHGGGYSYRLCPKSEVITEACF